MEPKFCEKCKYFKPSGTCHPGVSCAKWRIWFEAEWRRIRRAAEKIKKDNGGAPK